MPSSTRWFNDNKNIILHEITGEWRIVDLIDEIYDAAKNLNTALYQPKYFIMDLRNARGLPSGILAHRDDYNKMNDDDGVTIVVGAHPAIKIFVYTMQKIGLTGLSYFADDFEAALDIIKQHQLDEGYR